MILNADKFGYYSVNNKKTYSKIEAIQWNKTNDLKWIFNEDVFDLYDWKVEPKTNLSDLYKLRCKQIRQQYDYVVLMYSGGSDSHNILKHWIESGIKIDEIATWNYNKATSFKTNIWLDEIEKTALPTISELQKQNNFKFRHFDASDIFLKPFIKYKTNYEYYINNFLIPLSSMISFFREEIEDYKNIINSGKKLCFVWGHDKPHIYYDGEKYYTQFADTIDSVVSPYVQQNYKNGWYDELFYYTPDLPEMMIKQLHIVKNFINLVDDEKYYYEKIGYCLKNPPIFGLNKKLNRYLKEDVVKKLIYPFWSLTFYDAGKCDSGPTFSTKANFLLDGNIEATLLYKNIVQSYFKNFNNTKNYDQVPKMFGKKYYLE